MTDIAERLHTIRDHLRTGRFGQREVWEEWLTEAADEVERLRKIVVKVAATDRELHPDWKPLIEEARRACGPKP